jgi:hypothetical protein
MIAIGKPWILSALLVLVAGCAMRPLDEARVSVATGPASNPERQIVVTIRDSNAGLRAAPGSTARAYSTRSTYQASPYARRVIAALEHDYPIGWVAGWRIDLLDVHCVVFVVQGEARRDELLTKLSQDVRVESVQPMNTFATSSRTTEYNDPYFSLQKGVGEIHVPEAQRWSRGRGVTIAVIDTGVDTTHPELAGRIRTSRNFVDEDAERFRMDRHGTAVAGVIAALTNNGQGIVGVAPAAELIALKACWQDRPDEPALCNTLTLAEALAFAIERRARIINLSLTGPSDPLLARLVARAIQQGILILGASAARAEAESDASIAKDGGFPLSVPGVIAVADADTPQRVAATALLRPVADRSTGLQPLLAAPGREVLTLAPGGRYDYVSGASISTAMVSGVVALLLERDQRLQNADVRALLERTAVVAADRATHVVDACDAVAALVRAPGCRELRTATEATLR